jgi:hypothetical protein
MISLHIHTLDAVSLFINLSCLTNGIVVTSIHFLFGHKLTHSFCLDGRIFLKSNPITRSTFINLVEYGINSSVFYVSVLQKA